MMQQLQQFYIYVYRVRYNLFVMTEKKANKHKYVYSDCQ